MTLLRLLTTLLLFISFSSLSQSDDAVDGQLFVQLEAAFNKDISWERNETALADPMLTKFVSKYNVTKISCPFKLNIEALKRTYLFEFENIEETNDFIRDLEALEQINYAEVVPTHKTSYVPNDPQYSSQWHLQTIQAELIIY